MNVFELQTSSINGLVNIPLHNVTRGVFHNTQGGSQWPFHLQIPPGALNMTTNSREPGLPLDLLPKFCCDTSDTACNDILRFTIREKHF